MVNKGLDGKASAARTMEPTSGDLDRGRKDDVGTDRGTSKDMNISPAPVTVHSTTTVLG